eukprot:gene29841-17942_t
MLATIFFAPAETVPPIFGLPESMPDEHYVDPLRPNTQQKSQWDQRRASDEDYQNPVEVHGQAPPAGGRGRGPSPSPTFDEDPPAPKPKPSNPFDEDQPLPKPKQGGFDRGWDDEEVISPPPMKTQPRARVRMKPEGKPPTPSGSPPPIRGPPTNPSQGPGSPPILGCAPPATAAWEDEPNSGRTLKCGFVSPLEPIMTGVPRPTASATLWSHVQ